MDCVGDKLFVSNTKFRCIDACALNVPDTVTGEIPTSNKPGELPEHVVTVNGIDIQVQTGEMDAEDATGTLTRFNVFKESTETGGGQVCRAEGF